MHSIEKSHACITHSSQKEEIKEKYHHFPFIVPQMRFNSLFIGTSLHGIFNQTSQKAHPTKIFLQKIKEEIKDRRHQ